MTDEQDGLGGKYNMPIGWESMSDEELDAWFKQERARRMAMNQDTAFASHARKGEKRLERRAEARNEHHIGSDKKD